MDTRPTFPRLLAAVLGLGALLPARGQLADASPFLPPGTVDAPGASADGGTLELRGIMSTSVGYLYCIYDPAKKSSSWVGLNEDGHGYVVKAADPARDSVTLQAAGRTFNVALHQAKVAAMTGQPPNPSSILLGPGAHPGHQPDGCGQAPRRRCRGGQAQAAVEGTG